MIRLDNFLVKNGFAESRTKAQSMIKNSFVKVNGKRVLKPSFGVEDVHKVEVQEHKRYVSRSAHKLDEFLSEIGLDVSGCTALDIGSSTGGFTQVLLERGVKEVSAVDVGKDQLHKVLRDDARVFSYESCDIRKFESEKTFDLITSDVAFISLHHILDDVERLSCGDIILLFKPQFEVGREAKRDKNGVVLDEKEVQKAMMRFEDACKLKGWKLMSKSPSKLTGKEGNLEYCYYYKK